MIVIYWRFQLKRFCNYLLLPITDIQIQHLKKTSLGVQIKNYAIKLLSNDVALLTNSPLRSIAYQ